MNNIIYSVWLSEAIGAENKLYTILLDEYGDAYSIYRETEFSLAKQFAGAGKRLMDKNLKNALRIMDECRNSGIEIVLRSDDIYPKRLLAITAPPFLLYVKGKLIPIDEEVCVGVVGTRDISVAGDYAAKRIGFGLAAGGAVVISGLAQGVDSAAHIGCIGSGGITIAVLGSGHNTAARQFNRKLFQSICKTGAIISEYPPSATARRFTYPQRNRIISGISQAVVVVEAGEKSGALITARYALKQGRIVYAVTNSNGLLDYSGGVVLLEEGANLIRGPEEILAEFELLYPHKISRQKAIDAFENRNIIRQKKSLGYIDINPKEKTSLELKVDKKTKIKKQNKLEKIKKTPAETAKKLPVSFDESGLGVFEREVCKLIFQRGEITSDEICMILSSDAANVGMALTALELSGFMETAAGGICLPIDS